MSAEAWTILGTGGALFIGLAGLAVAIWRSLDARLDLMAQQHAADLRDLRADHGARLDRLDARQFEMAQALARIEGRQEQQSAASASNPSSLQDPSHSSVVVAGETRPD